MEKERNEEKKILLVYRNNELFEKYVPKIKDILSSFGYNVKTHSFTVGTDEQEN